LKGYETAHIDELDVMPVNNGEFVWRPVRRRQCRSAWAWSARSRSPTGLPPIKERKGTRTPVLRSTSNAFVVAVEVVTFVGGG